LAGCFQFGLQFVSLVEMVFDRALVAAGDENHLGNACGHRFFHRILDQGLVHDGQHFLRLRLGGRKKSAAKAGYREHGFSDSCCHVVSFASFVLYSVRSSNARKLSSSSIVIPSSWALTSLLPASAPATT